MGTGDALNRLNSMQNLSLGMTSGVLCKLINYPLLSTKNAVQQGRPISYNPKIVYRGLPMACVNLGGSTAVQFLATGFFQKLIKGNKTEMNNIETNAAAFLGGVASGIPNSMWELIMIQQQNLGTSIVETPTQIVKEFGAIGLFRGVVPTIGRESLYTMAMLGATPMIQKELQEQFQLESNLALAVGALTGSFFSATITHPMDTIKTCMQGDIQQKKYTNIRNSYSMLLEEYGKPGLFKGLAWRITLITTTFFLVNKIKQGIAPVMFPFLLEDEGNSKK
jgi:solute carrier family 25 carnitine/acylcarnitine transporter 20/29